MKTIFKCLLNLSVLVSSCLAETLSLNQAINMAIENNKTIMYNARQSYYTAGAQLKITESAYRPQLEFLINSYGNYSRTLSNNEFNDNHSYLAIPGINLNYTILTPWGSQTRIGYGFQTRMNGLNAFYSSPQISLVYQQPLSLAGIQSGHSEIYSARKSHILAHARGGFCLIFVFQ